MQSFLAKKSAPAACNFPLFFLPAGAPIFPLSPFCSVLLAVAMPPPVLLQQHDIPGLALTGQVSHKLKTQKLKTQKLATFEFSTFEF